MLESFYALGSIHTLTELAMPQTPQDLVYKALLLLSPQEKQAWKDLSPQSFSAWPTFQLPVRSPYLTELHFLPLQGQLKVRRRSLTMLRSPESSPDPSVIRSTSLKWTMFRTCDANKIQQLFNSCDKCNNIVCKFIYQEQWEKKMTLCRKLFTVYLWTPVHNFTVKL